MSATNTARQQLAEALKPLLGKTFTIFPDAEKSTDTISKPTLFLIRTSVARVPGHPLNGAYTNVFGLWVVVPQNAGEDALDDALEAVVNALQDVRLSTWETAERDVWGDSFPAYRIQFSTQTIRKDA